MKLFYIPNEAVEGDQLGPRATFQDMVRRGELSGFAAYPLNLRMKQLGAEEARRLLLEQIRGEQPQLILLSKAAGSSSVRGMVSSWREAVPRALVAYYDGDPYGWFIGNLTRATKDVAREVDVVFSVGLGNQRRLFELRGARRVEYTPSLTDTIRFGHEQEDIKECSVVMFGRYGNLKKLPFITYSGAKERLKLARLLQAELGDSFYLYGSGYPADVRSQGYMPYDEQERANRKARVTASWNHFPRTPYYFSDRLPISLISGVPHVTNAFPGCERVFRGCPGVYFARTPQEGLELVRTLLKKTDDELRAEGEGARRWVFENLTCDVVLPRVIRRMITLRAGG